MEVKLTQDVNLFKNIGPMFFDMSVFFRNVPHDSNKTEWTKNIPMQAIVERCQNCPAKHVLLILDCCYSGYAAMRSSESPKPQKISQFYLKQIASRSATQLLAAGQEDQPVSDRGIRPGYSAFTGALLSILEMERDLDDDLSLIHI